jgi:hypothetical protein
MRVPYATDFGVRRVQLEMEKHLISVAEPDDSSASVRRLRPEIDS